MINIGYYDPFNVYPLIQPNIESKLPLTNLHWHIDNSLKSIAKLPVKFIETIPKKINNDVFINLMLVTFKDLEMYKSQVRPLIKEWLKSVSDGEWLIIAYDAKKDKIFKSSVFEKLKIDFSINGKVFNSGNKNRCYKLKETNDNDLEKLEIYNDFINHLKDLILDYFNVKYLKLNDNLSNCNIKDLMYVKILLEKSKLFEDLLLYKDSLTILDEGYKIVSDYMKVNTFNMSLPAFNYKDIANFNIIERDVLIEDNYFNLKWAMFQRKKSILIKIMDSEHLISLKSIHLSNLYQDLIFVLNDLLIKYNEGIYKFNYMIIDCFLKIKMEETGDIELFEFYNFRAELKLFQRLNMIKLGQLKGYSLGYTDIKLNDDQENKVVDKEDDLKLLKNEDSFFDCFEKLTESIIKDFLSCNRTKSIDILSIDLALLHHKKGNYVESLNILQHSYEFFINHGWFYMGGYLLEIYIECLEKQKVTQDLIIQSYLRLMSNIGNSFNKIDDNKYFTKINIFNKLSGDFEFPLDNIFKINLDTLIKTDGEYYFMNLSITNIFSETEIDSIELELSNALFFTTTKIDLKHGENNIRLISKKIIIGFYKPVRLIIIKNGIKLIQEFQSPDNNHSILNNSMVENDDKSIYFHQFPNNFNVDINFNNDYLLGNPELLLKFSKAKNIKLEILNYQGFKYDDDLSIKDYKLLLPIKIIDKTISLKIKVTYNDDFIYVMEKSIDTNLQISVSVQDIFKINSIFSRFQISSINSPIKLKSVKLINKNPNYKINKPLNLPVNQIITKEEIYSSFYEILINDGYKLKNGDKFNLEIEYSLIYKECLNYLLDYLNLGNDYYIFKDLVIDLIKFDYKSFILFNDLKILNIKELNDKLNELSNFLLNPIILPSSIKIKDPLETTNDKLRITVPVPTIDILQIVEFNYMKKQQYIVGEPIEVEMSIESSTKWLSKHDEEDLGNDTIEGDTDLSILAESSLINELESFIISIANDDNWLISGFKKKKFKINMADNSINKLKLILIPLNVGKIYLPKVFVNFENKDLHIDVLIKNGSESLLIVPELDTITFSF